MANILRKIIENDKGELRKLEKMAKKVMAYEDEDIEIRVSLKEKIAKFISDLKLFIEKKSLK